MTIASLVGFKKPRLKALLDHFSAIEDPREPWRVAHPLPEVLLLVVCGTICDCDDYDAIADRGLAHLDFRRWSGSTLPRSRPARIPVRRPERKNRSRRSSGGCHRSPGIMRSAASRSTEKTGTLPPSWPASATNTPPRPRQKEAILPEDLIAMLETLDRGSLRGRRDRAMLLLGFAGGLRRSEIVGLDVGRDQT